MLSNHSWKPPDINPDNFQEIRANTTEVNAVNPFSVHCVSLMSSSISTVSGVILLVLLCRRVICLDRDFRIMFTNLTIADILTAVGLLSNAIQNLIVYPAQISEGPCVAQSFISTMSVMASFFWTIVIGIVCFRDVWHYDDAPSQRIRTMPFIVLHLLCWAIPFGIILAAWHFEALGESVELSNTAGWCWIKSCESTCSPDARVKIFLWMLFTGKLWEFLSYLSIVNIFILGYFLHFRKTNAVITNFAATIPHAKVEIASYPSFMENVSRAPHPGHNFHSSLSRQSRRSDDNDDNSDNVAKLLFWIPVALIFARIWGTVRFVFDALMLFQPSLQRCSLEDYDDVFMYFQAIGDCSQTTCNFILTLIFSQNVRNFLLCRPWKATHYEQI